MKLRTYRVWKGGKYQGKMTALLLRYKTLMLSNEILPDIGRKGVFTWSRDRENPLTLGPESSGS